MKKRYIVFGILAILLAVGSILYVSIFKFPKSKIEVSGKQVDNSYNNFEFGGGFCRVGNNLYFYYGKNGFNYGLTQINSRGSKRIWWLGIWCGILKTILPEESIPFMEIREYQGRLWNWASYYDEEQQVFIDTDSILYNGDNKNFYRGEPFRETDYGIVYSMYPNDYPNDSDCESMIALYTDGKDKILVSSDDKYYEDYYVSEDSVYYWYYAMETNEKLNLGKYNLATGKDERLFEFPSKDTEIVQLFVSDGKVFVLPRTENESEDTLRKLYQIEKTKDKERKLTLITDDVNLCNTYGNNVYISKGYDGLYVYNVQTKEMNRLSSKCSAQSYIVDDTWVYFTDNNSTLWRVSNDGEKTEKVFG